MADYNRVTDSGDGTRPTTDGAVDNIGAGEGFSTKRNAAGEEITGGPAPAERKREQRKDVEGTAHDDAAPFGLTEDLTPQSNREQQP